MTDPTQAEQRPHRALELHGGPLDGTVHKMIGVLLPAEVWLPDSDDASTLHGYSVNPDSTSATYMRSRRGGRRRLDQLEELNRANRRGRIAMQARIEELNQQNHALREALKEAVGVLDAIHRKHAMDLSRIPSAIERGREILSNRATHD